MMKTITFLMSFSAIILFSCNNTSENSEDKNNSDTSVITENQKINIDTTQVIETKDPEDENNLKELSGILKDNSNFYKTFQDYTKMLNSEITSEDKIKTVLKARNNLISDLTPKIDNFYSSTGETNQDLWNKVEKELVSIGFNPIYAEGMFVDLDKAPVLTDKINKYASEAFRLEIEFNNNYSKALGGEYPYAGLQDYFDAFKSGYKLFNKYFETEYYKNIEDKFNEIVLEFADIHKVGNECFEGGLHTEYYPWSAPCNIPELFVKRFPNTVFTPVFKELQKDMSEITGKGTIYLVVTNTFEGNDALTSCRYKIFELMEKGIDIVHSVNIKNNDGKNIYFAVYRFYSDKNKAEDALNKIKKIINDAKIVTLNMDENGTVKEIQH